MHSTQVPNAEKEINSSTAERETARKSKPTCQSRVDAAYNGPSHRSVSWPSPEDEFTKLFSVNKAPVIAQQLAEEYISVKYYKVPLKEFRGTTTNLGRSLRKL